MSSIDLSPEALTRLKTLAQKATPGPWETFYPVTGSPIDDILYITSEERRIDGLFDVAQIHNTSPNQPEQKVGKYICEQRANAAFIAATHPGVVLAMCEEIERLRDMRLNQVGEAAMSMLTEAITAVSDGKLNAVVKLGTECPYCGYESSSIEEAKAHDGTCPKHPAVIRAARLEKEADWLAEALSHHECPSEIGFESDVEADKHCADKKSCNSAACWREAARKAVEGAA